MRTFPRLASIHFFCIYLSLGLTSWEHRWKCSCQKWNCMWWFWWGPDL